MWTCQKCSYRNGDTAETCFNCGSKKTEPTLFAEVSDEYSVPNRLSRTPVLGCLLSSIGFVIGLALAALIKGAGIRFWGESLFGVVGGISLLIAAKSFWGM